jgi:hypothetical protein
VATKDARRSVRDRHGLVSTGRRARAGTFRVRARAQMSYAGAFARSRGWRCWSTAGRPERASVEREDDPAGAGRRPCRWSKPRPPGRGAARSSRRPVRPAGRRARPGTGDPDRGRGPPVVRVRSGPGPHMKTARRPGWMRAAHISVEEPVSEGRHATCAHTFGGWISDWKGLGSRAPGRPASQMRRAHFGRPVDGCRVDRPRYSGWFPAGPPMRKGVVTPS